MQRVIAMGASVLMLSGCVTDPEGRGAARGGQAKPDVEDSTLKEIPEMGAGWTTLKVTQTAFRAARIEGPDGTWTVDYQNETVITTADGRRVVVKEDWYPEEGGADAAMCRAYAQGGEMWICLVGTSDLLTEEVRMRVVNGELKEIVKYSLEGDGMGPGVPGQKVPPSERMKRKVY